MEVSRVFSHREFGRIGDATLFVNEKGSFALNGKALGEKSALYLMNFALQSLQDAYAGSKSVDEAKAAFAKKLDAIVDGTIGTRSGGGGVAPEVAIARQIVRAAFKSKHGAKSEKWIAFAKLDDDAQDAELDAMFERNREKLAPVVAAEVKRRQAEAKKKAELADSIDL